MSEPARVLLAMPDGPRRSAVRGVLDGFVVAEPPDVRTAAASAAACRPDLIILDGTDPVAAQETVAALRRDFRTASTSILHLVDAVPGALAMFGEGDDFVVYPRDASDLGARVRLSLLRSQLRRGINPLTGLPGNTSVVEEIARRQNAGETFACLYIDIDRFKAYNDRHGFALGDGVILSVGRSVVRVIGESAPGECFVGHLGGDDFVVLAPTAIAVQTAERICEDFGAQACGCALSIGVVDRADTFADPAGVATAAAEAKAGAKSRPGSAWVVWRAATHPA